MAYEPHEWECGEDITETLLNHMEEGIADASEHPVPYMTFVPRTYKEKPFWDVTISSWLGKDYGFYTTIEVKTVNGQNEFYVDDVHYDYSKAPTRAEEYIASTFCTVLNRYLHDKFEGLNNLAPNIFVDYWSNIMQMPSWNLAL